MGISGYGPFSKGLPSHCLALHRFCCSWSADRSYWEFVVRSPLGPLPPFRFTAPLIRRWSSRAEKLRKSNSFGPASELQAAGGAEPLHRGSGWMFGLQQAGVGVAWGPTRGFAPWALMGDPVRGGRAIGSSRIVCMCRSGLAICLLRLWVSR